MLNRSQNEYEREQSYALQLPAQKIAVNRNATSLLCHVGLSFDSKQVHARISILMEGAMRTYPIHSHPIHSYPFHSQMILDLEGGRLGGCTMDEHRLRVTLM